MTSIRLFSLCEGMKWSHLPVAGGLYDQHPDLLDQFRYIFMKRNEHEAAEQEKREAEQNKKMKNPTRGMSSRSPRRPRG